MAIITLPFPTFTPGTVIASSQVNQNNAAIIAQVNGNLDNSNIAAMAGIVLTKLGLSPGGPAFNKTVSNGQTWGSGLTTDTQPRVVMISDKGLQFGPGGVVVPDIKLQRTATTTLQLAATTSVATLITDTFVGAVNTNLTGHTANTGNTWSATSGTIDLDGSDYVFCQAGASTIYIASGTFPANQTLTATWNVKCISDIQFAGFGVFDAGGNSYYLTSLNSSSSGGGWAVQRLPNGGAATTLSTLTGTPLTPGNIYTVSLSYSTNGITATLTWTVMLNTTLVWSGSTTDTNYPACNQVGFRMSGAAVSTTGHHIGVLNAAYGGAGILDMNNGTIINVASISGSIVAPPIVVYTNTFPYTVTNVSVVIRADMTGGAGTITLPAITLNMAAQIFIKKVDTTNNELTISAGGGQTIDGASSIVVAAPYQTRVFTPGLGAAGTGTNWDVV